MRTIPPEHPTRAALEQRGEQTMVEEEPEIQIEQRQARCARCGKMVNVRGFHLTERPAGGHELLFCSALCRDEYVTLFGLAAGDDATSRGRA